MSNNINDFDNFSCSARQSIMNTRTYVRNIPSQPLQPYLEARPVLTKYSIMPIVDPRREIMTPLVQRSTYNPSEIFNPGNATAKAPWSGFASNINHESDLRGQLFALQECSQASYVPSSKSSLYNVHWKSRQVEQPFPGLFKKEELNPTELNADPKIMGVSLFNNATRQQLKDLTIPTKCN
jgi:hypothetical protein